MLKCNVPFILNNTIKMKKKDNDLVDKCDIK